MVEIVEKPLARADLKGIWRYSYEHWGAEQADRYLVALEAGILKLALNPLLGKARDYIRPGYRSIQIARHVVYYRKRGAIIEIVRVLHERMEPGSHLE